MKSLGAFAARGVELLAGEDPALAALLERELARQTSRLDLVAASSAADPSVLACQASPIGNVTAEGYPGARYHAGCELVDAVEQLAIDRAKAAFGARYANVQPHSGTSANEVVLFGVLVPGDTILGLALDQGGHLTHGAKVSISGRCFNAVEYGLGADGRIDYAEVRRLAERHRPRMVIAGASAYPRTIDFHAFRQIADSVGAYLLADISHIAGLVAAGEHPSPIDEAHFTTTSTYKQLFGPRGGLILMGKDWEPLAATIQSAVFPLLQGTPNPAAIAAKARALGRVADPAFRALAKRIVDGARAAAERLAALGHAVLTGGTDNHLVMIDTARRGLTGLQAERALEECHIVVNKNRVPGDRKAALVTSGIRLGTNNAAARGMGAAELADCAALVDQVLRAVEPEGEREYRLNGAVAESVRARVAELCNRYPIPRYSDIPRHSD